MSTDLDKIRLQTSMRLSRAIYGLSREIERTQERYLWKAGWVHRCDVPGAYWVWTKTTSKGQMLMAPTELAVKMQSAMDYLEALQHEDFDEEQGWQT